MKTAPLKTQAEIEEFGFMLESSGIKIPPNVKLIIKVEQAALETMIPKELLTIDRMDYFYYHSRSGITFTLDRE